MTRDARESLTALAAVSTVISLFCLSLLLIPNDLQIPRWLPMVGLGLNLFMLAGSIIRRRRKAVEKPE